MKISRSDLILYAVAFISAIAVVVLVYSYIENRIAEAEKNLPVKTVTVVEKPELAPVLVAKRDLYRGEKIEQDDLEVLMLAKEGIKIKGIFSKQEQALGKIVKTDLFAGEWLFDKRFVDKLETASIEEKESEGIKILIKPGMRAIRVPVDPTTGLLGIVSPGDHVDVVSVFTSANGKRQISRTILQNIEVLSIGQENRFKPKTDIEKVEETVGNKKEEKAVKKSMVALHVNLQQAEELALAQKVGSIQLVLRNSGDAKIVPSDGVNVRVIESLKQKPGTTSSKAQRNTIELIQDGKVEKVIVQ